MNCVGLLMKVLFECYFICEYVLKVLSNIDLFDLFWVVNGINWLFEGKCIVLLVMNC